MSVVSVVGLGYVGLPLAIEFGKRYRTIGFDLSAPKVAAYLKHQDPTGEVGAEAFSASTQFEPTTDPTTLQDADFIVVAVPTPCAPPYTYPSRATGVTICAIPLATAA